MSGTSLESCLGSLIADISVEHHGAAINDLVRGIDDDLTVLGDEGEE